MLPVQLREGAGHVPCVQFRHLFVEHSPDPRPDEHSPDPRPDGYSGV
jgi:hypothetical protein